jgi:hypothetical protein
MKHLLLVFSISFIMGNSNSNQIGICTKSTGDVQRSGEIRSGKIRKGESIYDGDKITTGEYGFLSILNIKDRSIVKIFGNTSLKIYGSSENNFLKSEINIFGGRVSAEIIKLENREFLVKTPVSIASVKGTYFLAEHRSMNHHGPHHRGVPDCVFSVITGKVEIQNTKSGKTILIEDGKTVISTPKGEFLIFETTEEFTEHYMEPE